MVTARPYLRVAAFARAFVVLALIVPVAWSRDRPGVVALVAVAAVWLVATGADLRPDRLPRVTTLAEALAIGCICGAAVHSPILVALVVPPFTAGVRRGLAGLGQSVVAQVAGLLATLVALRPTLTTDQDYAVFSWSCTGLGLGLLGMFLHGALRERSDPLAAYRHAQGLLRQLISLSGGLHSGLDPVSLGGAILSEVRDELPTSALALYVPRGQSLTPLITKSIASASAGDRAQWERVATESWRERGTVLDGRHFAFPLVTGSGTPGAVVAATLSERVDPADLGVKDRIARLRERLGERAVHLDTALLFAAFRDAATADERRRLAREMHDGVAQDIASLGYLVDGLAESAPDERQAERIAQLRDRISAVVGEVRRSLVNLRTSVGANESLGAAIGSVARNLSEASGVPIHVTLDERTERLRPEVEGELFRIAQEALTNAVKHARASAIEVTCWVRAPAARITVADDGRGMQPGRADSQGLSIMRERAHLIGASLEITQTPGGGLTVSVVIAGEDDTGEDEGDTTHDMTGTIRRAR